MKPYILLVAGFLWAPPQVLAQHPQGHPHAQHGGSPSPGEGAMAPMPMQGMFGPYAMTREASGTSWQPESSPHQGAHAMLGDWMAMAHGFATVAYGDPGSHRVEEDVFGESMLMLMAQRPLGPGTFGVRNMLSLDPLTMGREGYPLLLQTGETPNGQDPLIDRQHPHDFFMELASSYSLPVGDESAAFVYVGLPGEPALGPPTFMHRFSGMDNPEAPITHHWLDSTHITFGVATLGYMWRGYKVEGSIFTGREPDESRWDFDQPRFDSYATRLSYNPTKDWALQVSYGHLDSPEQLEPEVDTHRFTTSATYHVPGEGYHWQTTAALGYNINEPGRSLPGLLLESSVNIAQTHTIFGRAEAVRKDELFQEGKPLHGEAFTIGRLSVGYIYDFPACRQVRWGLGTSGSMALIPDDLQETYGTLPLSWLVFARVKL